MQQLIDMRLLGLGRPQTPVWIGSTGQEQTSLHALLLTAQCPSEDEP
jgi:hypothetical protein